MKEIRLKREFFVAVMVFIFLVSTPAFPTDSLDVSPKQISNYGYGISLSLSIVPIVGGKIIESEIPNTEFEEAFDTGYGGRVEIFYCENRFKYQLGWIYNHWQGQSFQSDDFPNGVKFDDLYITGPYFGFQFRFPDQYQLRPYLLASIGLVMISPVDSTTNGNTQSLWDQTFREYIDIGIGIEYILSRKVSLYLDVRYGHFGYPDYIALAFANEVGCDLLPITFGINYQF